MGKNGVALCRISREIRWKIMMYTVSTLTEAVFFNEKPTIIMFESWSVTNILADWYGKEV